jgi:myo-inositol 2-dehydrogenase/D-chiro-inositol 1-dehydrogenase
MSNDKTKPRLRFFENAAGQQHIPEKDKYLYAVTPPTHRLAIIGTGTIGQEHMRVARLLGRAAVHGIFDSEQRSIDVALANFAALEAESTRRAAAPWRQLFTLAWTVSATTPQSMR